MSWWDTFSNTAMCGATMGANGQACIDAVDSAVDKGVEAAAAPAVVAADGMVEKIVTWLGQAAGDLLVSSMTWWVTTDSVDLSPSSALMTEPVIQVLIWLVVTAGVVCTGIMMSLTRRGKPLVDMLVGGMKFTLIQLLALTVLTQALRLGDGAARALVADGAQEFGVRVSEMLGLATISNPMNLMLVSVVLWVLSFIQWVFGFLRQGGIVVLAALIIFAGAGQLFPWGRQWFPKIATMLTALVFYKPMAALIYSLGFKIMGGGEDGEALESVLLGTVVLTIAVIALPSMMAFFSWAGPSSGGVSSGGVMAMAGAGAVGAAEMGSRMAGWGGGGDDKSQQSGSDPLSSYMDSTGPGTGPAETNGAYGAHNMPDPQPWETPGGGPQPGASASPMGENPTAENPDATAGQGGADPASSGGQGADHVGPDTASPGASLSKGAGPGAATGGSGAGAAAGAATGGAALAVQAGADAIKGVHDTAESAAGTMTGSGDGAQP
ncbi:hypothetical protein [Rhodococcus opacus]|uniref:hypothetical protein n=1 Tax=Rhodococcus opacus TaxID=37919 RepID=UPI00130086E2|nr:hypothetical protein [Rhodococcus opacus]